VYGNSPWLKFLLYDQYNVYEVVDMELGSQISSQDNEINQDLLSIVKQPGSKSSACLLKKFAVDYLYIPDDLNQRFYTLHQSAVFYEELNMLRFSNSPFIQLEKEFHGDHGERIQIYKVNVKNVDKYC
jgi:hypothetical protein